MRVVIDGTEVQASPGMTILEACGLAGVTVPTLCHHPELDPRPSCFVCVVRVAGRKRLAPACATPVEGGMVIDASSEEVRQARRAAVELLLSDHAGDCIAPCQTVCPAGVRIPEALRRIAHGEYQAAFDVFHEATGMVRVLGHLCHQPCQQGCRRNQLDGGLGIRALERFSAATAHGRRAALTELRFASVAVVGGGPSGLSAAHHLRRLGHRVELWERSDRLGGGLWGFVPDRLPEEALQSDLADLLTGGVTVRLEKAVAGLSRVRELLSRHAAVLLACGAKAASQFPELARGPHGIHVERTRFATSEPLVFAAGSAVGPMDQVVRRVASGRRAAEAIHAALTGTQPHDGTFSVHVGRMDPDSLRRYAAVANPSPRNPKTDDNSRVLSSDEAKSEALRCLRCSCATQEQCRLRRLAMEHGAQPNRFSGQRRRPEIDDSHPDLVFEPGKCISCGICVRLAQNERSGVGLAALGRGFDLRIGPPIGFSLRDALGETARRCAEACPTSALSLRTWPKEAPSHE